MLAILLLAPIPLAHAAESRLGPGVFDPPALDLVVGESVTWTNGDDRPHTVTSSWDGGATFNAMLKPGEAFAWSFAVLGTWNVHCVPHAYEEDGAYVGMTQAIHVVEKQSFAGSGEPRESPLPLILAFAGLVAALFLRARRTRA